MTRLLAAAILLFVQAADLPPAYPRPGTTKLLDNERVQVWDISWLKQQYPLHRHRYDLVGVYYSPGDRTIISPEGARRPVTTKAWEVIFQQRGVTHIEEGASDVPLRAVFAELKEPEPLGKDDPGGAEPRFPPAAGKQLLDNPRATIWELPAATAGPHRHLRDAVVVAFTANRPRVTYVRRGIVHADEGTAGAERVLAFELK